MSRRLAAPCLAKRLRVLAQPWNGRAAPWGST
jgi:hypothetical protein